ncbi:MAG: aminopeptidase [Christensenellaceae bacterium]
MKKKLTVIILIVAMIAVVIGSVCYVNYDKLALAKDVETRTARVDEYAEVVAKAVDTQTGDRILIRSSPLVADFANLVAKKCYELGAIGVNIRYSDGNMDKLQATYLNDPEYKGYYYDSALEAYMQNTIPENYKLIRIMSLSFGIDEPTNEKYMAYHSKSEAEKQTFMQEHNMLPENADNGQSAALLPNVPWVAAAYPTKSWAQKVYPELNAEAAYNKMLDDFLDFARIGKEGGFAAHEQELMDLAKKANELDIVELHYKSKTADLHVPLHQNSVFAGGPVKNSQGTLFEPNIPTEEIFSMPSKYGVNGTVTATRPVQMQGEMVEGLKMTFKDGRLVDASASAGIDAFNTLFDLSAEEVYLGEAALVSKDSPIFQSGKVYYHMLIDENAGAHIALGNALVDYNLKSGSEIDKDINQAEYHMDITIGSEDLTVTATLKDGSQMELIKNGLWNF